MSPTPKKKKSTPAKAKPAKAAAKPTPKASKAKEAKAAPDSGARINVLVWLKAKKGKEVPLARALKSLVGPSRAEPGCLVFDLHSSEQPGDFFLHEIWTGEAALANHRQTPHFKHWSGLQAAILESRRRYLAE